MISIISGTLATKDIDRVEVMTAGGIGYEIEIPLGVFESLPRQGENVLLHTSLVVKEDSWKLFGFSNVTEKQLFEKLLAAKGVGPSLAIGMMSALSAPRLMKAIREKDIATLQSVPRVGRKKAEQLILDISDKLDSIGGSTDSHGAPTGNLVADDALRALSSLGYTLSEAERGVRAALDGGYWGTSPAELIRAALAKMGGR